MKIDDDYRTIIMNPTQEIINQMKVQFDEVGNKRFLVQIRERVDENSYDTFILYEKNEKTFLFHEYENPSSLSYYSDTNESSLEQFVEMLEEMDWHKDSFFKQIIIKEIHDELQKELSNSYLPKRKNKI